MKNKTNLILEKLEDRVLLNAGVLNVQNSFGFNLDFMEIAKSDTYYPEANEGLDTHDILNSPVQTGYSDIYSNVEGQNLEFDVRPENSMSRIELNLFYNGTITQQTENHLEVKFPYSDMGYDFGTKPITIETETGQRYDVRQVIAEGEIAPEVGKIPLKDVPAGASGVYATATVNFNKTTDLNNDGNVDVVDLALLGENWLNNKANGDYVLGDISGSEGKPDGVVNLHDFAFMSENWLNNKANDDSVLDISGSEGKPDGVVNLHDFAEFSRQYLAGD